MKTWKLRVQDCRLHCVDNDLLTNVRYADDVMLYAKSDTHFASMVVCLVEELAAFGSNLNTSMTNILTTENLKAPMFLAIGGDRIEVLRGDFRKGAMVDIQHRRQIAWMKFNEFRDTGMCS